MVTFQDIPTRQLFAVVPAPRVVDEFWIHANPFYPKEVRYASRDVEDRCFVNQEVAPRGIQTAGVRHRCVVSEGVPFVEELVEGPVIAVTQEASVGDFGKGVQEFPAGHQVVEAGDFLFQFCLAPFEFCIGGFEQVGEIFRSLQVVFHGAFEIGFGVAVFEANGFVHTHGVRRLSFLKIRRNILVSHVYVPVDVGQGLFRDDALRGTRPEERAAEESYDESFVHTHS